MAHYVVYARSYKDSTDTLFPVIIFCHGFAIDIFLQKVTLDDSVSGAACAVRAQALYDKGGNNAAAKAGIFWHSNNNVNLSSGHWQPSRNHGCIVDERIMMYLLSGPSG